MEMVRRSGQQGVPVIVIDDQVVVGFNRPRLEQLLARRPAAGAAPRRGLGALVGDAAAQARRLPGIPSDGAYVGGVKPGSPAERAGLHAGDVITAVDRTPVHSAADLERALAAHAMNPHPIVAYERNGTGHQVEVSFDQA